MGVTKMVMPFLMPQTGYLKRIIFYGIYYSILHLYRV